VQDYSHVAFPTDTRNCVICHEQNTGAAQATAWLKPNRAACGACHDNVNFATGEAHANLPQVSDNQCASCHFPQGELEFDVSVRGAHTVPRFSRDLPGVVFDILAVNDGVAGKRPSVTFTVKDKSGKPIPLAQMNRLNLILAGPNTDYATYISEDVRTANGTADGRLWWTFQTPIPADAKGSYSIAIEGRREIKLMQRTTEITARDAGVNKVFAFAVDGSKPAPRRTVVSLAKCNSCHYSLSFHGDNRNTVEACVVCHNPLRTAGTGGTLTVDFRTMVHRIHTGEELKIPYVIGSYNFNRVLYPGDRRNCAACHVDGSEQLPLKGSGRLNVVESSAYVNPTGPITAACTSCHTSVAAASHALANTTRLGESCDACHSTSHEFGVPKVHAR
jgi:OmcA/MtrC family decaheme c-type cytochrome